MLHKSVCVSTWCAGVGDEGDGLLLVTGQADQLRHAAAHVVHVVAHQPLLAHTQRVQ